MYRIDLNSTFNCPVCETHTANVSQRNLDYIGPAGVQVRCSSKECNALFYVGSGGKYNEIMIERDGFTFQCCYGHSLLVWKRDSGFDIFPIPTAANTLRESAARWKKLQTMA